MALVIAAIAMTILELIRDAVDHMGVGLIPVVVVGLSLVFVGLCCEMKHRSRSLSVVSIVAFLDMIWCIMT
jgi:riboflavin transporter FmnP